MGDSDSPGYFTRFVKWVLSPFVNSSKHEVDNYKYLGQKKEPTEDDGRLKFMNIRVDNFVLGSAWGLLSGHTSEAFYAPVPDRFKAIKYLGYFKKLSFLKFLQKRELMYPAFVTARAISRGSLAGIVFDQAEVRTAKSLGFGHSTMSNAVGLIFLSIFFRVSTDIRHSLISSSTILGGYIIGSQIMKFAKSWSSNNSGDKKDD